MAKPFPNGVWSGTSEGATATGFNCMLCVFRVLELPDLDISFSREDLSPRDDVELLNGDSALDCATKNVDLPPLRVRNRVVGDGV